MNIKQRVILPFALLGLFYQAHPWLVPVKNWIKSKGN